MPFDSLLHRSTHPLSVTVLGSAGTYPQPGNPGSGYLVRSATTTLWVDTGPGTFGPLQEHVELRDVDAILVSHEHPDHWSDLPVVRNAARYVMGIEEIAVYGTAGTRDLLEGVLRGPVDPPFTWTTVTDWSEVVIGDVSVRFARTVHPVETLAMRFESGGRVFAYSSDTGAGWSFSSLDHEGTGFDLVLCEATLAPEEAGSPHHLTAAEAGAMAGAARAQRLALTHLIGDVGAARIDEASDPDAFDGPVEEARPGFTFTV